MASSTIQPITSILIANRGEIAARIIRTCKKMGIKSIAVFSDADRKAPFVKAADSAVFIGESNPAQSYLDIDKIIDTAKKVGASAIHPGYGFLSENVHFAKRCAKEGIIFIGPNPKAIEAMGSKSNAKALMEKHQVPVVPGYKGKDQSLETLTKAANDIGYPVLLKAVAGGGGKGMRIVKDEKNIEKAIQAAQRESKNAFGDDELIVEKYIASGRHIEFQIFGDQHGNAIHLLERECTIQRRYQKVIEESPSPVLDDDLRTAMGDAAVKAAKALNYDNAGTVEFIFDDSTKNFYFLEVNTRLQVEHPVTEEITGLDLVQMQIESAQGLPLAIEQNDVKGNGYAIECRLYAEDANNDFLPVTGKIVKFNFPEVDGLRMEAAIESGSDISVFYDPMIAKIIVWDKERSAAHRKMAYVLKHLVCLGIVTNQSFLQTIVEHPDFNKGIYDTHFIEKKIDVTPLSVKSQSSIALSGIAATLSAWQRRDEKRHLLRSLPSGWRSNFYQPQQETYSIGEDEMLVTYRFQQNSFSFSIGDSTYQVNLIGKENDTLRLEIDGIQYHFVVVQNGNHFFIQNEQTGNITLQQKDRFPEKAVEKVKGGYTAPMPSQIIQVLVKEGQAVKAGEGLIVLSSMKMESTLEANEDGTIEEIYVEAGGNVEAGFLLLKMK
ncbi:MAG: acetyl-CoA carboxylase biotin carboxylase subunit [Bacteroidetes bacterium]|nr:acetyl-CoA carboxylase biotin carboxylase subunit [Bacteroidota bacterium]